ncbi:unnamed protein product [Owenia fusiformis]|uniref:Small ribosomal subunit protein mS25 n=1 Tax=Owenia fusiformis TaxID=6347 RepID=A0A8S4NTD2_OWEFU|nr:unnamed protein product [Owenia fusiformis]
MHWTAEFLFWHFPQIQYKNPGVQMVMMKNLTPSPFIKCYFDDGESVLIDTWGKDRFQIYEHLNQVVGKSRATLEAEAVAKQKKQNEANFGSSYSRQCICEIPGQVPCSAYSVQAKEEFSKLFPKGKTSVLV